MIDVGGYKGDWAAQVLSVHDDATMHIFEPVPAFADYLKGRFAAKSSVHIHASGLGARDEDVEIGLSEDATSAYRQSGQTQTVSVRALATFLREHNITGIDLMAINAEGAEFDLLDHMIAEGLVETVHRLLVQFHRVVPKAAERRTTIQNRLRESHDCVFDFPFCWELWAKRAMPQ